MKKCKHKWGDRFVTNSIDKHNRRTVFSRVCTKCGISKAMADYLKGLKK